jgi:hypothetical protein
MKSQRVMPQVGTLGSQLGNVGFIKDAYKQATKDKPFSYLIIDYSDKTTNGADEYAVRTNIFPNDPGHTITWIPV